MRKIILLFAMIVFGSILHAPDCLTECCAGFQRIFSSPISAHRASHHLTPSSPQNISITENTKNHQQPVRPINIRINGLGGSRCAFEGSTNWTIQDVKNAIAEHIGQHPRLQDILDGTTRLGDEDAVANLVTADAAQLDLTLVKYDIKTWIEKRTDSIYRMLRQNLADPNIDPNRAYNQDGFEIIRISSAEGFKIEINETIPQELRVNLIELLFQVVENYAKDKHGHYQTEFDAHLRVRDPQYRRAHGCKQAQFEQNGLSVKMSKGNLRIFKGRDMLLYFFGSDKRNCAISRYLFPQVDPILAILAEYSEKTIARRL